MSARTPQPGTPQFWCDRPKVLAAIYGACTLLSLSTGEGLGSALWVALWWTIAIWGSTLVWVAVRTSEAQREAKKKRGENPGAGAGGAAR